jgi:hypothetical protein
MVLFFSKMYGKNLLAKLQIFWPKCTRNPKKICKKKSFGQTLNFFFEHFGKSLPPVHFAPGVFFGLREIAPRA